MGVRDGVGRPGVTGVSGNDVAGEEQSSNARPGGGLFCFLGDECGNRRKDFQEDIEGVRGRE